MFFMVPCYFLNTTLMKYYLRIEIKECLLMYTALVPPQLRCRIILIPIIYLTPICSQPHLLPPQATTVLLRVSID